jgi:hypothetical protein
MEDYIMSVNFIPDGDAPFNVWQGVLMPSIAAKAPVLNIPPEELTKLQALQTRWEAAFAVAENPATRTKGAVKEKQEARNDYEAELRRVIKAYITYNPVVTDKEREDMGLPVHDAKPTPAPAITSRPELEVRFSEIQRHTLVVQDSELKGHARPAHAAGFEIWRKVGDPAPATEADWQLVAQVPHSPHDLTYSETESGLRVYYRVRWVNTRGVAGPWSETVGAIIG